ncbi:MULTISPECIES: hypothetical protein [unclassified Coleofasciculus]|uniref:hypothetical protein n=1 Tax=unclassified Coleofasciculus TaxID=2692782 RepID=UPI0018817140|nr:MULTISPECIES: hypothetical protein [unclassified Coleofasciculus]MBE9129905.1 hypothetical protein [Coleofasciculus sp. LEGE 07081]MBE9151769.1 hypothetical protein [Coleofasciculus sp. LEGE 07092]
MLIKNRSFFPYVDFLPADQFKLIGKCEDKQVLLIGRTTAYGDPIVALRSTEEPSEDDLSACDLYELMKFSQTTINFAEM